MKNIITVCILFCLISFRSFGTSYIWVGNTSSDWTVSSNWNPGTVPGPGDNVTINSAVLSPKLQGNVTITNLTITADSLNLNGYTLTVNGSGTFTAGITTSTTGNALLILRGTTMTFTSGTLDVKIDAIVSTLKFNGSSFNKTCYFEADSTSPGTSNGGSVFSDSITIYRSNAGAGNMILANSTGNRYDSYVLLRNVGTGTLTTTNSGASKFNGNLVVENSSSGGIGIGSVGGGSDTLASGKTITVGSNGFSAGTLLFRYFTQLGSTAQSITLTGTAILNFINSTVNGTINHTAPSVLLRESTFNKAVTFTATGSTHSSMSGGNIFNDTARFYDTYANSYFRLASTSTNLFNAYATFEGVAGGYVRANMSIFKQNVDFGLYVDVNSDDAPIEFQGNTTQTFTGSASSYNIHSMVINKSSSNLSLGKPIQITNDLTFTKGNIVTTSTNLLTIANDATVSGTSDSSFADGPVKKIGNDVFVFPVGKGSIYRPVEISAPSTTTAYFTAEYFNTNQSLGSSMDGTMKYIHNCDYWNIARGNSSSNPTVKLYWDSTACGLMDSATVKVANYNGSTWKDLGNGGITGNRYTGKVANSATVVTWGNFALGYNKCFITANAGSDKAICASDSTTIGNSPVATMGMGTYTYSWSPSTALSSTSVANPKASPGSTTNYIVTVTDASGCSVQDTSTVTYNVRPTVSAGADQSLCDGSNITIGGSPTASGGASPYTYSWSPSTGLSSSSAANPTSSPSSSLTYIVTLTDANGCTKKDTMAVTHHSLPIADAGSDQYFSLGDSVTIGGSPPGSGGSGSYTYNWSPSTGLNNNTAVHPKASPSSTTNYVVIVTDGNGCSRTDTMEVTLQTIETVYISSPDTIGACLDNSFSLQFNSTGTQRFAIHAKILGLDTNSCNSASLSPVFIVADSATASLTIQNIVFDSLGVTWAATITTTGADTLWYHIYIDCSIIGATNNINLEQSLTDSSGNFIYHIFPTNSNVWQSSNLISPVIQDVTASPFFASYLTNNFLTFKYRNHGLVPANIKFRFKPDSTDYNGQLQPVGLQYAVGFGASYSNLTADSLTSAFLLPHDTLYVRQEVFSSSCLVIDTVKSSFTWQCNNPPADSGIFCTQCSSVYDKLYSVWNDNNRTVNVTRIKPSNNTILWDNSCLNDTSGLVQWEYHITNSGPSALDSICVKLACSDVLTELTFIPISSLVIDTICNGCNAAINISPRLTALCHTFYNANDLLDSVIVTARNFRATDTIIVKFGTFRCAEENDTVLLNNGKDFNRWKLSAYASGICQDTSGANGSGIISSNSFNTGSNLIQKLTFIPSTADLSISPGQTFGQSAVMEVDLLGITTSSYDLQLLGCTSTGGCTPKGYLRAVVHCETGLRIENPASDVKLKLPSSNQSYYVYDYPVYYHTMVPDSICEGGDYYFYFNLADSGMMSFLTSGIFEFTLQGCCGASNPATEYNVKFYIMPNPDTCLTLTFNDTTHHNPPVCNGIGCAWIPLSGTGSLCYVHCPGCKKPGMIVDNYYMKRATWGLQDSNNDGKCDSTSAQIVEGSTWFNNHKLVLKPKQSSYGDELEDFLTAHFQEGDPTGANDTVRGYNYVQMVNAGVYLNYLQLDRTITAGLDTLKVLPLEFTLYIDTIDTINPNCINCNGYEVDSAKFRTQHILHITGNDVYNFIDTISVADRYFFTFDTHDTLGVLSGNLHDTISLTDPGSYIVTDTLSPLTRFFEMQQYRLHVRYSECGTFSGGASPTINTVQKNGEIQNKMWMSGQKLPHNAFNNVYQAPNSILEMHGEYWTFDTLQCDTCTLLNQTFADTHYFLCETYGGFHLFFSQETRNNSSIVNDSACNKLINAVATSYIAANLTNVYPFEYRPPAFDAEHYEIVVPPGYHIIQSQVFNKVRINTSDSTSMPFIFTAPSTTGTFVLTDDSLPNPNCLAQNVILKTDTLLYFGSRISERIVQFKLAPDSCNEIPYLPPNTSVRIEFDTAYISCLNNAMCAPVSVDTLNMPATPSIAPLVNRPNFQVQYDPSITANLHQICDTMELSNPPTVFPPGYNSTAAGNVFIAVPTVSYLSNWVFYTGVNPIYPIGNIIHITPSLPPSNTVKISGKLCADYISCPVSLDTTVNVFAGYNCSGYPLPPFSTDSVCGYEALTITIHNTQVQMSTIGKDHPLHYNLCEPFEITSTYNSQYDGGVYPDSIYLDTLPPGLAPLYAIVYSCDDVLHDTLSFGSNPTTWLITGTNMTAIGEPDSALSGNCIRFRIWFMPECSFANQHTLPATILNSVSYCGAFFSDTANYEAPFISQVSSICTDCFTLTKTALQDTVGLGDTATFVIIICGNNGQPDTVSFTEYLPSDFDTLPGSAIPSTIIIPAQGCDTITISGIFNTPGACSDSSHINIVSITSSVGDTTLFDQACVTVMDSCASAADTIIPNGAFSASYGGGTGLSNIVIYITDTFFINTFFTLSNCIVFTAPGAQIIVLAPYQLMLDSTTISGCTNMWRGIYLENEAGLIEKRNSNIRQADIGVFANDFSVVRIYNSAITDCVTGIYVPIATGSINHTNISITGSHFGLVNGFLSNYTLQPAHDTLPKVGIEVNDMPFINIGNKDSTQNEFHDMNTGIVGKRSGMTINNSQFWNITIDGFYPESYKGTAIVSVGKNGSVGGNLTVHPVTSGQSTVFNSRRGIWTNYSSLTLNGVKLTNLHTGIWTRHCTNLLFTIVSGCTIEASRYGIDWRFNAGAQLMTASNNEIIMSGDTLGRGINIEENNASANANYEIFGNSPIDITSGSCGIRIRNVLHPLINFNNIYQNSTGSSYPRTFGMNFENTVGAYATCNYVQCTDSLYLKSWGLRVSMNSSDSLICNTFAGSRKGVFFGGQCLATQFKGNTMRDNFRGLEIDSSGAIGQQDQAGNRWINYADTIGAINKNLNGIQNSEFDVNDTMGTTLFPFIPSSNAGWFVPQSGSAFGCGFSCIATLSGTSDDSYEKSVALDSNLSSGYIPESKNIAKQQLYERLSEDSILLQSDAVYSDFYSMYADGNIGKIYEVKRNLKTISQYDSAFMAYIEFSDSLLPAHSVSLQALDSLAQLNPLIDYSGQRDSVLSAIDSIQQAISLLVLQRNNDLAEKIDTAQSVNNTISPTETPEENEKLINSMDALFLKFGEDTLFNYIYEILAVAEQCPYSGGVAVYKARTFAAIFDDETDYDDEYLCSSNGSYRQGQKNEIQSFVQPELSIIPNPADDKILVVVKGIFEGMCHIDIVNAIGEIVITDKMNCEEKNHAVSTKNLKPGIYTVKVNGNNFSFKIAKLIIAR